MNKIVRVDDINSFSVVIPVYNEEGCLEELIESMPRSRDEV